MEDTILIKALVKRHKGSLTGIFVLLFMVSVTLITVLSIRGNAKQYMQAEIERAGFGDITAWVSNIPDEEALQEQIIKLDVVEKVESQNIIYAKYEVHGQESDSEGQLLSYVREQERYRFLESGLNGYRQSPEKIREDEVYVSPAMMSMMDVRLGDTINFSIARNERKIALTVAGFYEDPFMGSSMIGMKGFLISQETQESILRITEEEKMDALARAGAMVHIFAKKDSNVTSSLLNEMLNEHTSISRYTEFIHSKHAILDFMLVLQNAFSGLMFAFTVVLLCISMFVLGHSMSATLEQEYSNIGVLKTLGISPHKLRKIQIVPYVFVILLGILTGILLARPLGLLISHATITTTGILIPNQFPVVQGMLSFAIITLLLLGVVLLKLKKLEKIKPLEVMLGKIETKTNSKKIHTVFAISGNWLEISLAFRQFVTESRRYVSVGMVAILLVFFASLVGRMEYWLGPDGKGMMDAFNPADHDIGVQILGELSKEEVENVVLSYTDITDQYLLAMPDVSVNGINYTANVITEPERFHIISGTTSVRDDEMVLTETAATDLGVTIGDTLSIGGEKGKHDYRVTGIYQCANDMGNNIGMSREGYLKIGQDEPQMWCYHYFLSDSSLKQEITEQLEREYRGDVHIHENSWPGLMGIIAAMQALLWVMYGIVMVFVLLVTIMTGSKILSAEQRDMGIYKSLGFSTLQLRITFALRFAIVAASGSILGTVLAAGFTDPLVSSIMKLAGISNFSSNLPVLTLWMPGVIVTSLFILFAYVAARRIKKMDMTVLVAK